jgi:hypothetical protein
VIAAIAPTVGLETIIDRWNEIAAALGERNRKTKTTNLETEAIRMKPTTVESTSLATVAYDADHQFLQIEFRDRTIYQYSSVPPMYIKPYSALLQKVATSITPSAGSSPTRESIGRYLSAYGAWPILRR